MFFLYCIDSWRSLMTDQVAAAAVQSTVTGILLLLLSCLAQVIDRIMNDVLPVIRQSGLAGHAEYVTRSAFFTENPIAIDMLVDVLTDRCVRCLFGCTYCA